MHTEFIKYLKSKLNSDRKVEDLLSNIKDLNNLTVKELVMISNKINESYNRIINMYCNEGCYYYGAVDLDMIIEHKDYHKLRRLILDGALVLNGNTVHLRYRPNEINTFEIKPAVYQSLLKLLLEVNEIKLAQMISNRYLAYEDLSLSTPNIINYLYDEESGYPISYVYNNYSKIPEETRSEFETKMVNSYLEAIGFVNSNNKLVLKHHPFLDYEVINGELVYKIDPLYLEFNEDNKIIILNAIKGIN